jgi:hypothetical protein
MSKRISRKYLRVTSPASFAMNDRRSPHGASDEQSGSGSDSKGQAGQRQDRSDRLRARTQGSEFRGSLPGGGITSAVIVPARNAEFCRSQIRPVFPRSSGNLSRRVYDQRTDPGRSGHADGCRRCIDRRPVGFREADRPLRADRRTTSSCRLLRLRMHDACLRNAEKRR